MAVVARFRQGIKSTLQTIAHWGVPVVEPKIVDVLPHGGNGFTQGLAIHAGQLYESTGGETNSSLRRLDARDGSVQAVISIENDFAEGIACVDDRLYQLSWKSGVAREFALPELQLVRTHKYAGEGWGLAAVDGKLLSSDGSSRLQFWTPRFELIERLRVRSNNVPIRWLNDMECVGECVYLNSVASPYLFEVNLRTRDVTRLVDCRCVISYEVPKEPHHIFNGIAHDPSRNVFFVTGKNWRSLFVIEIPL